jgi:transcriptional regulator with XRE-family HTH domain
MKIHPDSLSELARCLRAERKRQGLSREQAAAVCKVSTSFIRDAEHDPGRCSLALLLHLMGGMGLTTTVTGWPLPEPMPDTTAPAAPSTGST